VAWLAQRHAAGEALPVAATWRIEENRWSACRHGLAGTMAELDAIASSPTAGAVRALLDELDPVAAELGGTAALDHARTMLAAGGGSERQRDAYRRGGARQVAQVLADCFLAT
jgi:carboxylate-amine ligase